MRHLNHITIIILLLLGTVLVSATDTGRAKIVNPKHDGIWLGNVEVKIALRNIPVSEVKVIDVYLDGKLINELKKGELTFKYNFGIKPKNRRLQIMVHTRSGKQYKHQIVSYHTDDTHTVNVEQMVVPVVVTNSQGKYVMNLKKEDFVITEDNRKRDISFFDTSGESSFHMVFLIDISSSMKDKIDEVKTGARMLIKELMGKDDRAAVIMFNHDVLDECEFTGNPRELHNALALARPFGSTALYDAVRYSVDLLKPISGHNIIVLFSDGEDNSSAIDPYTLMKIVNRSNSVIYSIGKRMDVYDNYQDLLKKVASSSGGMSCFFNEINEIQQIYDDIREDIKAQYILQYSIRQGGKRSRFRSSRNIKVKLTPAARKKYGRCKIRTFKFAQ